MMRTCVAVIGIALLCSRSALGAEAGWQRYVNPRFGVVVNYPAAFSVRDRPPDNGDGQTFRTPRGDAVLRIFGSYNVDHEPSARLMQSRKQAEITYSYIKVEADWFVLSWSKNGRISYLRCNLGGLEYDTIGCVELNYPAADANRWALIVDRISKSLRVQSRASGLIIPQFRPVPGHLT